MRPCLADSTVLSLAGADAEPPQHRQPEEEQDNNKVETCLAEIKNAAIGTTNLMPLVVIAVENYCTLGEIADVLRGVYGEY